MKADVIEKIVFSLLELKKTKSPDEINLLPEYDEIRKVNIMLYDMVVKESSFDIQIFKEMMKMKRRLESGEDQYSVDVRFGQYMADKYITPVIN